MKKLIIILILIAIAVVLAVLLTKSTPEEPQDTTSEINQELESIDIGDLDREFEEIDSVLESL